MSSRQYLSPDLTEHGVAEVHAVTSADPSRIQTDTKVCHVGGSESMVRLSFWPETAE